MSRWIAILALLALPLFAQRGRVDNLKAFRQDLAAAVSNGSLSAEEKQKYDAALQVIDSQREVRQSGTGTLDRKAARQAMQDLVFVSRSANLKEEDRAKLAEHFNKAKGKRRRQQ